MSPVSTGMKHFAVLHDTRQCDLPHVGLPPHRFVEGGGFSRGSNQAPVVAIVAAVVFLSEWRVKRSLTARYE
jgi:hypothetical protein